MRSSWLWYALPLLAIVFIVGRYLYQQPRFINGEKAPTFEAELLNGETIASQDLMGQYVLLDFWGSWCGPCRAQNPALRALYDKYSGAQFTDAAGFTILSIGVEEERERWLRAIEQDELNWPTHVLDLTSSLRFFDAPLVTRFGVKQLPTSYLIDPNGMIIGVNLSPEQLDKLLGQRLTI